jgi:CheY-like chemotaxis protein
MRPVVLVVEDEFLVRLAATGMVEEAGFEAVEAANADEAIAILEARPDIRVVFTDILMPGSMDGLKLAAHVRGKWPPIKIIATSGHHRLWEGDVPDDVPFLPKPYTHAQISALLRRLTGTARRGR